MDQQVVREHAEAHCEALLAGDFDRASVDLSNELRSNLGSMIALMPLPLTEATVESVDVGGSGIVAVLHLVGESGDMQLQTRWKERDGRPTIVEASRVAAPAPAVSPAEGTEEGSE